MSNKNPYSKTDYMPLCMCLGIFLGMAVGAATGTLFVLTPIGAAAGLIGGIAVDAKLRKKNEESDEDK